MWRRPSSGFPLSHGATEFTHLIRFKNRLYFNDLSNHPVAACGHEERGKTLISLRIFVNSLKKLEKMFESLSLWATGFRHVGADVQ